VEPSETVAVEPQPPKLTPSQEGERKPPEVTGPELPPAPDQLPDSNTSDVVVSLGDKKLTMEQIRWKEPNPRDFQLVSLATSWLETELLYAEAERRGLTDDPKSLFLAELNRKMSIIQLLKMQVGDAVEVSDEDVRAYYEEKKGTDSSLQKPGHLSFTHIRTRSLEEAQKVLERLKAGEDMSVLAKEVSTHGDASKGGIVRKAEHRRLEMSFGDLVEELTEAEQGQLVGPVELPSNLGFEVARKDEEVQPEPLPFKEIKDRLKPRLESSAKFKAFKALRDSILEQAADKIVKSQRLIEAERTSKERSQPRMPMRPSPGTRSRRPTAPRRIQAPRKKQ
jgi:parvulin-like peptidyl-prolyl isomerase